MVIIQVNEPQADGMFRGRLQLALTYLETKKLIGPIKRYK